MPGGSKLRRLSALACGAFAIVASAVAGSEPVAGSYRIDWPQHGIRADLEYGTRPLAPGKSVCAGKVSIENYGERSYAVLFFSVIVFSEAKERIATDRFALSSHLKPGGRAEIPFDPRNPLNPVNPTESYSECPKDMRRVRVILDAF